VIHKPVGAARSASGGAVTVCRVTAAPAVGERLARLLLLALTALGVAALHTIGHAAFTDRSHHPARQGIATVAATVVSAPVPGDRDGCDGDGCTHQVALPAGTGQTSRWWEVCAAILSLIAIGALVAGLRWRTGGGGPAASTERRRPPPLTRALGLTLAVGAVVRT